MNLKSLIAEFANRLSALVESQAMERARHAVLQAVGAAPRRGPGRPPKGAVALAPVAKRPRKKGPKQLCPVPGCKNPAAPVFGMVCAKHKDLPKAKIKQFREARRAKKLGLPAPKAPKAARRRAPKAKKKVAKAKRAAAAAPAPAASAAPAPTPPN